MKIPSRERLFSSCLSVSLRYKPFNSQREPCLALKCISLTFESVNNILYCENSPSVRSGSKFTLLKFWKGYFWQNKLGDSSKQIIYNLNKHYLPNILAWNLFSLAAILNFAVGWSEAWKQEILGVWGPVWNSSYQNGRQRKQIPHVDKVP